MRSEEQVGNFLNLIAQDVDGRKSLDSWLRREGYAIDLVCKDIHKEMDAVRPKMKKHSNDIIADGLVQNVLRSDAPTVYNVLRAAAQDTRAEARNRLKSPEFVS